MIRPYEIRLEMIIFRESVTVVLIVEKMLENKFMWFEHVDYVVKSVDQKEISQITRDR